MRPSRSSFSSSPPAPDGNGGLGDDGGRAGRSAETRLKANHLAALEEGSNHRLVFHGIQAAGGVAEEAAYLEQRHGSQRDLQLERMKLPALMGLPMPPLVSVLAEGAVACIHVSTHALITILMHTRSWLHGPI